MLGALWLSFVAAQAVSAGGLSSEMSRLGVRDALVIASQVVDEHPVWSPDGKYLAANVDGQWIRVALDALKLEKAEWHGGSPIGVVSPKSAQPIDEKRVKAWDESSHSDSRRVVTRAGTTIELRQVDLATQFVVTRKGAPAETRWSTSLEACHSPALSPDDRYVAFICEQNGVIVALP